MKRFMTALKRHKWRYLALIGGVTLFVYPSALLIRAVFFIQGNPANPDLHQVCYRMPFNWLAGGNIASFDDRWLLIGFLGAVLGTSLLVGPLFCGWLCPIGSSTEFLSRIFPDKMKINLSKKLNPAAIRYGFLGSFVLVSALAAFAPDLGLANICCRYCASSTYQNLVEGIFDGGALAYWHSGGLMIIGAWLLVGGVFWKGGRGWCMYGCPLGAVSNILYTGGSRLGFTYKLKHNPENCIECGKCDTICPSWALTREGKNVNINRSTCITCLECQKICPQDCFSYSRGKLDAK